MKNLIDGLLRPNVYDHPVKYFEVIETHISHVILTGEYAYKIKKPLKCDFLDYSALDARRSFCEKELLFNTRLATEVYLEVVTINQLPNGKYKINGEGPIVEYALKMREFQQSQLFDTLINNGRLEEYHFDAIAERIARFYQHIESAGAETEYGSPDIIMGKALDNFSQAKPFLAQESDLQQLDALEALTKNEGQRLNALFKKRKEQGFVKACHGDLHLSNIALLKDTPVIFDCIEFNEYYRWTDTMADVGFLMMDLYYRDFPNFANHFLNHYLTYFPDFEGLALLPFYISYRAMVRAKIQLFQIMNENGRSPEELLSTYRRYAQVALQFLKKKEPVLMITHGVSGSGKSTLAHEIAPHFNAVHLRADIERKRLFGLKPTDRVPTEQLADLYSTEATERTYQQLLTQAKTALEAGFCVIVDATFLRQNNREAFLVLSKECQVPFVILDCVISPENAQKAIDTRVAENTDASDATVEVLIQQLASREYLTTHEQAYAVAIQGDTREEENEVLKKVTQHITEQGRV